MSKRLSTINEQVIEPLTQREREFLSLLADFHLAMNDIAREMTISTNSARWYARQVYSKLGAGSRREAVRKAGELKLLVDSSQDALPIHNLPSPLTSFFGREKEINDVRQILLKADVRMVTLTGAGGVGKTRLAIKAAESVIHDFPHGVYLFELAPLTDSSRIIDTLAGVLSLETPRGSAPLQNLITYLKPRRLLLVLDNCEHLIEPLADVVVGILTACPNLKILATSRELFKTPGEYQYIVSSLPFPSLEQTVSNPDYERYDAVRLFIDRARMVDPNFTCTRTNAAALIQICHKLDGLPLALELAAARLKVLDVDQIADLLEKNIFLLSTSSRSANPRHQTIQASILWSYQLLAEDEKNLLCLLSVFAGGWTLAAAQHLYEKCYLTTSCEENELSAPFLECFSRLIEKSLVMIESRLSPAGGTGRDLLQSQPRRFRMLEPIRQFAAERLEESGNAESARLQHLEYYIQLAETTEPYFYSFNQAAGIAKIDPEIENFRLALDWALKTSLELELRLSAALMWFWHIKGRWNEGAEWLEKGLAAGYQPIRVPGGKSLPSRLSPGTLLHAKALMAAGFLQSSYSAYEYENGAALLKESLAIFQRQKPSPKASIGFILLSLSRCPSPPIARSQVVTWANQSFSAHRDLLDDYGVSESLLVLAGYDNNPARAKEAFVETLRIKKVHGDLDGAAGALIKSAELAVAEGDLDLAEEMLKEGIQYAEETSNLVLLKNGNLELAWVCWVKGAWKQSIGSITEAQIIARKLDDRLFQALCHYQLADVYRSIGDLSAAVDITLELSRLSLDLTSLTASYLATLSLAKNEILQGAGLRAENRIRELFHKESRIFNREMIIEANYLLGEVHRSRAAFVEAAVYYQRSITESYAQNDWHTWPKMVLPLLGLAWTASLQNDPQQSALLFGAAKRRLAPWHNLLPPGVRATLQDCFSSLHATLGSARFDTLFHEGFSLQPGHIVASLPRFTIE
jgi:predicted ATPase/DNA-binding CsgD family transcriptional regulator